MNTKRNYGLDFLKFICAFMVICIHIPFPEQFGKAITSVSRIAVPIFFMITGYFYSSIKDRKKETNQIIKIAKIFISANVLYFFYNLMMDLAKGINITKSLYNTFNLSSIINFVFTNASPFGGHLWYLGAILYVLIIVYLFEKVLKIEKLYPVIPVLLLLDLVFGKYSLIIFGREFPVHLIRNFIFVGLPYFLIGDILFKNKFKTKPLSLVVLVIIFVCTTIIERSILDAFNLNGTRDHYLSTTFLAVFLFMLFCIYGNKICNRAYKLCSLIGSELTLGIYILHPIFIGVITKIVMVLNINALSKVFSYIGPILIFIISIIATWVLKNFNKKIKG